MPCIVESASLEPKFIAGGVDAWIRPFHFNTGEEIGHLAEDLEQFEHHAGRKSLNLTHVFLPGMSIKSFEVEVGFLRTNNYKWVDLGYLS
ncbi:WD40 repeat-containing protein [Artemisia annua]|uniref:WD40 repeat-containing protein n=1 Tax=Artemisia annua TaxID=35608 RepID=A0A2U1PDD0_ARTAN|nr:WD40 repeat-containing protein [Artemisia annua]